MGKPIGGITRFTGAMDDEFLIVIQIGTSTGDPGKAEMRSLRLHELREFVRAGFGNAMRFRGSLAVLPDNPEINDYFHAQATFESGSAIYMGAHLYEYSADGSWNDITDVFSDYVRSESFEELRARVSAAEVDLEDAKEQIAGFSGGRIFQGDCTNAQLAEKSQTRGHEWWITDLGVYKVPPGLLPRDPRAWDSRGSPMEAETKFSALKFNF